MIQKRLHLEPALVRLALAALGSLAIYLLAFVLPASLAELSTHTRLDVHYLYEEGSWGYTRLVLAFIGLILLYGVGYRSACQLRGKAAWIIMLVAGLAFMVTLLFMAPFDAADIYDNIMHGRILGIYSANPFVQVISDYPRDVFFEYSAWKNAPSAYGPLWEMLAGLAAILGGDGIIKTVIIFKLLPGIFHLASLAIVILFLRRTAPQKALAGALLLAWNPLVLYETWGNGHNDMVMVFWILLAAWWLVQRRYTLAAISLLLGALIKFIPILLIPAVLVAAWQNLAGLRARFSYLIRTFLLAAALVFITYFPFWNGFKALSLGRRMEMFTTSLPAVVYRLLKLPLGLSAAARVVSIASLLLLAGFTLYQSFRMFKKNGSLGISAVKEKTGGVLRGKPAKHLHTHFSTWRIPESQKNSVDNFLQAAFNILAFYLMLTCLWFQQWYALWLIGLAPLLSERPRRLALLIGFWVVTKQLVFGPHLNSKIYYHPENAIWLEPILAISVLGVPWILTLIYIRKNARMEKDNNVA